MTEQEQRRTIALTLAILVCVIIAGCTFWYGCAPEVFGFCPNYSPFHGVVYNTMISKSRCGKNKDDCWSLNVYAFNPTTNATCRYRAVDDDRSLKYTIAMQNHYNNSLVSWERMKNTSVCFDDDSLKITAYFSLIFMVLTVICVCICVGVSYHQHYRLSTQKLVSEKEVVVNMV